MKRAIFYILMLCIPLALLAAAEGLMRLSGTYQDASVLFIDDPDHPDYYQLSPFYIDNYFNGFSPAVGRFPFRKQKSDSTYRVFVLGGSTTAGFPYQYDRSFPARLKTKLAMMAPGYHIEVINLGVTALNSYAIYDMAQQLPAFQPDAVAIYAGHNEFYGSYGVASGLNSSFLTATHLLKRLSLTLNRSHLFLALKSLLQPDTPRSRGTLMAQAVEDRQIPVDSEIRQQAADQFQANMSDAITSLRNHDIPVVIATVVANLKDQPPLSREGTQLKGYAELRRQAVQPQTDSREALARLRAFKDADTFPFRAPSQINKIIQSFAGQKGVTVIETREYLASTLGTLLPGNRLFTDHLHPNDSGYELLATPFAETLHRIHPHFFLSPEVPTLALPATPFQMAKARFRIASLTNDIPFRSFESQNERQRVQDSLKKRYRQGDDVQQAVLRFDSNTAGIKPYLEQQMRRQVAQGDTIQALAYLGSLLYRSRLREERLLEQPLAASMGNRDHENLMTELFYSVSDIDRHTFFRNGLASLHLTQKELTHAKVHLDCVEQRSPHAASMLYNMARYYALNGDTSSARSYFNRYQATRNANNTKES